MKKFLMFTLTGLLALGAVAIAQPPFGGAGERSRSGLEARRGPGGPGGERLFAFLDLSEQQQTEWKAAHEAQRDATEPLREAMRANHQALREAVEAEDALRIGELTLEGKRLREEMHAGFEALQAELASILDAEQREKWEAFQAARGDGLRFERRGPRGPHGSHGPRGAHGRRGPRGASGEA
ncbi:MAG TPA: periplasmic heavy metal sensor [Thermoanaerobaculia bacterium]|nr:periplasmic heavy metal sensor [Thermoanaerobaculia bacterium]